MADKAWQTEHRVSKRYLERNWPTKKATGERTEGVNETKRGGQAPSPTHEARIVLIFLKNDHAWNRKTHWNTGSCKRHGSIQTEQRWRSGWGSGREERTQAGRGNENQKEATEEVGKKEWQNNFPPISFGHLPCAAPSDLSVSHLTHPFPSLFKEALAQEREQVVH